MVLTYYLLLTIPICKMLWLSFDITKNYNKQYIDI